MVAEAGGGVVGEEGRGFFRGEVVVAGAGLEPFDHVVAVGGEDDVAALGEEG